MTKKGIVLWDFGRKSKLNLHKSFFLYIFAAQIVQYVDIFFVDTACGFVRASKSPIDCSGSAGDARKRE